MLQESLGGRRARHGLATPDAPLRTSSSSSCPASGSPRGALVAARCMGGLLDQPCLAAQVLIWLSARDMVPPSTACRSLREAALRSPGGGAHLRAEELIASYVCLSLRLLECGSCLLEGLDAMEEAADFIWTASGHYAFTPNAGVFVAPNGIFENYGPSHRLVGALTIAGGCRQLTAAAAGAWPREHWWWMFDRWYVHCEYHGRVLTTKEELLEIVPSGGSRFREASWLDEDLRSFSLAALRPAPVVQPAACERLYTSGDGLPYTVTEGISLCVNMSSAPAYQHPLVEQARAMAEEDLVASIVEPREGPAWVVAERLPESLPAALSGALGRVLSWEADGPCLVAFAAQHGAFHLPSSCLRAVAGPPWIMESDKCATPDRGWNAAANPPRAVAPRQLSWAEVAERHRARLLGTDRGVGPSGASTA